LYILSQAFSISEFSNSFDFLNLITSVYPESAREKNFADCCEIGGALSINKKRIIDRSERKGKDQYNMYKIKTDFVSQIIEEV